jgi:hypothetical protein
MTAAFLETLGKLDLFRTGHPSTGVVSVATLASVLLEDYGINLAALFEEKSTERRIV